MNLIRKFLSAAVSAVLVGASLVIPASAAGEGVELSSVTGKPGETVEMDMKVKCNNNFESLDLMLEWDDVSLKSSQAAAQSPVMGASEAGDGYVTVVLYVSEAIADGVVAKINFTIPDDAAEGTKYTIKYGKITTFAIFNGDDLMDKIDKVEGTITVSGGGAPSGNTKTTVPADNSQQAQGTASAVTTSAVTSVTGSGSSEAASNNDEKKSEASKSAAAASENPKRSDSSPVLAVTLVIVGAAIAASVLIIILSRRKRK